MAASKKQIDEITKWFKAPAPEGWWVTYGGQGGELCGGTRKKGSRGEALKVMIKINPDEKLRDEMLATLKAQVKHDIDAKRRGEDPYRWPYATTYLNRWGWEDTIDSVADQKAIVEQVICSYKDCGEKVHGPNFTMCTEHVLKANENPALKTRRRSALIDLGLVAKEGESYHDYAQRCKKVCLEQFDDTLKSMKGAR